MCGKRFDLDDVFAYSTGRTVLIRDRRLGLTMLMLQLAIFAYIVLFTIISKQGYKVNGVVTGTARMQLQQPTLDYRWPDGQAPYCVGVSNSSDAHYAFPGNSTYVYSNRGIAAPQGSCIYFDAADAVQNPLEGESTFLPTRITSSLQQLGPLPACNTPHSFCNWNTNASELLYLADAEMYTVLIDHSFSSSVNIARSSSQMSGALLDVNHKVLDPCVAYSAFPSGCPDVVALGVHGKKDIVPLKTLLMAGGVESLDQLASFDFTRPLDTETHRYAGIVIVVTISYTNYALASSLIPMGTGVLNDNEVMYFYTVAVIPDQSFKVEIPSHPYGDITSTTRMLYDQHGIRIVVMQAGHIGAFDFQTLLINLTAALSLLSVAHVLTDLLMTKWCSLRNVYRQYKERMTIDFSDLRDAVEGKKLIDRFNKEEHLVDPIPPAIQAAFAAEQQRLIQRKRTMELPAGSSYAINSNTALPVIDTRRTTMTAYGKYDQGAADQRVQSLGLANLQAQVSPNPLAAVTSPSVAVVSSTAVTGTVTVTSTRPYPAAGTPATGNAPSSPRDPNAPVVREPRPLPGGAPPVVARTSVYAPTTTPAVARASMHTSATSTGSAQVVPSVNVRPLPPGPAPR